MIERIRHFNEMLLITKNNSKFIKIYNKPFLSPFFHKIHCIFKKKKRIIRQIQNRLLFKKINSQFRLCFTYSQANKLANNNFHICENSNN